MTKFASVLLCAAVLQSVPAGVAAEQWVTEEVLKLLFDIRKEVQALRAEVKALQPSRNGGTAQGERRSFPRVAMGPHPRLGDAAAPVAIVEFSDYQCPYCMRHATETLPRLIAQYVDTGKIQYVMRDFPLSFHANARLASSAATCAGQQGRYWEMHDALFGRERTLDREFYIATAARLELNLAAFQACLDEPAREAELDQSLAEATALGVSGTPAFFIGRVDGDAITNAVQITGAQPYSAFAREIERLLP